MAAMTLYPVSLTNLLVCCSAVNRSCNSSAVMWGEKEAPLPSTACCKALGGKEEWEGGKMRGREGERERREKGKEEGR